MADPSKSKPTRKTTRKKTTSRAKKSAPRAKKKPAAGTKKSAARAKKSAPKRNTPAPTQADLFGSESQSLTEETIAPKDDFKAEPGPEETAPAEKLPQPEGDVISEPTTPSVSASSEEPDTQASPSPVGFGHSNSSETPQPHATFESHETPELHETPESHEPPKSHETVGPQKVVAREIGRRSWQAINEENPQHHESRWEAPGENVIDDSWKESLSRFSYSKSDAEPRRLLRSQRQSSAKLRRFLYIIVAAAVLLLILIGLTVVLRNRSRRVIVNQAAEPATSKVAIVEPTSSPAPTKAGQEPQPELVSEEPVVPEPLEHPYDPSMDKEFLMAATAAPTSPAATPEAVSVTEAAASSSPASRESASPVDFSSSWTNSLGMKFVPVGNVLFSVWETRVKDFEAFSEATGRERERALFEESDDHPVSEMNWHDTQEFCAWLTKKERAEGIIDSSQHYRLPTDLEWSLAAGIEDERGNTPESRDGQNTELYPWGSDWPPSDRVGNIADRSASARLKSTEDSYDDGYVRSAPVGSFTANSVGVQDLSGNLWEWCQDPYGGNGRLRDWRVMRGGSWATSRRKELLSSYRNVVNPDSRELLYGFRCVLVEE